MSRSEVSLQLRLNRSQFSEGRSDLSEHPGGSDVADGESDRSVRSDRPTKLDVEEDEIESRFRDI